MAKILVVDDDPDIIMAVRMSLENAGHEVIEASNGKQGIQKIKQEHPDLIILDVMMETKDKGFQMARQMHDPNSELSEFKDLPILILTSIQSAIPLRDEPSIDDLPVELFVDKPIDPEDLLTKVEWMLSAEKI